MGSNVSIVQATKLKRVKTFIKSNGEKVDGGAEAHFGDPMEHDMGGVRKPGFAGEGSEGEKK